MIRRFRLVASPFSRTIIVSVAVLAAFLVVARIRYRNMPAGAGVPPKPAIVPAATSVTPPPAAPEA